MKMFFKDLWDLQKESFKFCKKHPVGVLVWTFGGGIVGAGVGLAYEKIREEIDYRELQKLEKGE